ncbi:MAG: response regulator transcription factor [Actinomycetota bacterium]|nr:response regulator transcription factor [Actinomycetota bacterium]MDK1027027.1 response regulator transcription factor [Actinomycetota bacterium]MDK1039140.1 response regulator transcription factor [Actinomycetota bacterium]MDK1097596.1 response regulator transcription factor [Actinomycetota bacterium]MDK1292175.1 response regulator transcription factor [Actinomycetota bacterium]
MTTIRVLLADDHAVLRAGLRALLENEPDLEVVGQAEDGIDCVEQIRDLAPDVAIVDINMPRCDGIGVLEKLRHSSLSTRVLILTMHDDLEYLRRVLALGGAGYVLKEAASDELLTAIRTVHEGGVYLHPDHAQMLAAGVTDDDSSEPEIDERHARFDSLSNREAEVFRLVALGYRNKEIAEMAHLSVKTVETYKARLMKKLGINGRAALVRYALEMGILS